MQKFEQSCTIICRKVTNLNHCNIEKNIAYMKYHEYRHILQGIVLKIGMRPFGFHSLDFYRPFKNKSYNKSSNMMKNK